MFKKLFASLALLLFASLAMAATVNLDTDPCSDNRFCYNVPNDASIADLTLYASTGNGGVVEVIFPDGTYYLGHGTVCP
jgi:hypothetical protein